MNKLNKKERIAKAGQATIEMANCRILMPFTPEELAKFDLPMNFETFHVEARKGNGMSGRAGLVLEGIIEKQASDKRKRAADEAWEEVGI